MDHQVCQLLGREPLMAILIIMQPFHIMVMVPQGQKSKTETKTNPRKPQQTPHQGGIFSMNWFVFRV